MLLAAGRAAVRFSLLRVAIRIGAAEEQYRPRCLVVVVGVMSSRRLTVLRKAGVVVLDPASSRWRSKPVMRFVLLQVRFGVMNVKMMLRVGRCVNWRMFHR